MKKRLVSLVLVLSMILGSMSMGFAAGPLTEGIEDSKVVKAVERLAAFGIVEGFEDGKYHPEYDVTREQFAKVLVEALGLGSAATAAQGPTKFSDVEADRWSAGYVNVAVGQGILKGYPDGTFGPAKNVTYAEAVTMLVRALGYQDSFLPGTWPGNYVAKAAEEGITSGVVYSPTGTADRGSMAVMLNNTLDADVIKIQEYGTLTGTEIKYVKTDISLLAEKMGIHKLEEAVVTATPKVDSGIDEDQVRVVIGKDYDVKKVNYDKDDVVVFDVIDKVDTTNLLGLSLNVYVDENDKDVVFVEESDKPFRVLYDVVDPDENVNEDEITLIKADKEYSFEDDYELYLDNKSVNMATFAAEAGKGDLFVKAVLSNKGNIKVIDAQRFEKGGAVIALKADSTTLTYRIDDADDEYTFKTKDYDKVVVMDNAGNIIKLEDIKANDVAYINDVNMAGDDLEEAASKDEVAYVVVVKESVTGDVTRYRTSGGDVVEVRLNGTAYDVASNATVSSNEDKDVYLINDTDGIDALDDITDDDADALLLFDAKGYVRHITTDAKASSADMYGVITATNVSFGSVEVKMLTQDESVVRYDVDFDAAEFEGYATEMAIDGAEGDIVKYTLNKDGEIDSMIKVGPDADGTTDDGKWTAVSGTLGDDFESDSLKLGTKWYNVSSNVVVFDYFEGTKAGNDFEDVNVVDYASLDGKGDNGDVIVFVNDKDEVRFVALVSKITSDDERAAYVLNKWVKAGDDYVEVAEYGVAENADFEVSAGIANVPERRVIAIFTENTDGTVDIMNPADSDDFTMYTGEVTSISGRFITIEGDDSVSVRVETNAVVYEKGDVKDFSDIDRGDNVTVAVKNAKAQVVKIYDMDDETALYNATYDAHNTPLDKVALDAAELAAAALDADDYTAESFADLTAALALPETSQALVDAKVAAINAAIDGLVEVLTATADVVVTGLGPVDITITESNVTDAAKFQIVYEEDPDLNSAVTDIGSLATDLLAAGDVITINILAADGVTVLATGTLTIPAASTGDADIVFEVTPAE
ncbi:middle cell wall protein [Peptoclostridium acidaminophilum DSM 3953]|uniref:Middle cell wall protein n=1 Tax=Peptoclostridium acidaminophilum DSM 3953 TaxID=1286171 RepID=W8U908_PEPAC|nr:S-layer homology domain-containing protein [Peptoclostridium acidaminophilum]AHM57341.1 middle cell wall protein [Peptoclostridium acidaminophilum DSM 3953]